MGEKEWTVGPGEEPVFWTAAAMNLVGPKGRNEFDRQGLARLSRLVDALPHLDGVVGVSVKDVPPRFRDVAGFRTMIANTGNDRLFDWLGEYNSFLVPFKPFGAPTVNRAPSPHIQQFIIDLGAASGADQGLTEPNGELGLVSQGDPEWQDQHGAPRDPQPGNGPSQRDTQGEPEDDSAAVPTDAGSTPTPADVAEATGGDSGGTDGGAGTDPGQPADPGNNGNGNGNAGGNGKGNGKGKK